MNKEEKLKKKLSKAGSIMGQISQLKHPRSVEFLTEIGKKGAVARWSKETLDK
jgi:hypothetical protein